MKKQYVSGSAMALGSTLALTVAFASSFAQASESPFSAVHLDAGYQLAQADTKSAEGKCGANGADSKKADGKCGEGKCGAKETDSKKADGKCGEGKCGAQGGTDKKTDDKKAEGSCGGNM